MFISKLKIHNFRNIQNKEFLFHKKINVFHGDNGVGKTSILESIHYLSSGKSFRKGTYKNLINFNSDELTVYLETQDIDRHNTFAVNKNKSNQWKGKIDERKTSKQSEITNLLPVISIDPEIYRLVDYGPIYRRNFLDWLVFHVKHDYLSLWKKTYRCIKQLNILYKNKKMSDEVEFWEGSFIKYSEEITKIRKYFFNLLQPGILSLLKTIQPEIHNLTLSFIQGWSEEFSLKHQLMLDRQKNFKFGTLQHGPHKTDIRILIANHPASHTLSRGQKKTLSIVFHMAYIQVLVSNGINPVLCLDDFDAELDDEILQKVAGFFKATGLQIFITSVQKNKIQQAFSEAQMFHVKHDNV